MTLCARPTVAIWSQGCAAEKRETQIAFLDYCTRMVRENFVYNLHRPALNLQTEAESAFSTRFARFITERNAAGLTEAFTAARNDVAANANSKIVFFDLSITVILLLKQN